MPTKVGQQLVDKKGHRDYVGGEKRDIHEADIEHLENAAKAYKYVAEKENWKIIECSDDNITPLSIEDVHEKVYSTVKELIE